MSNWSHLPNAQHIDRILASTSARPQIWKSVWNHIIADLDRDPVDAMVDYARWNDAYIQVSVDFYQKGFADHNDRLLAQHSAVSLPARGGILALITQDDCGHYLELPSEKLEFVAAISGNPAAVLLVPVVRAFELDRDVYE
jgi:hypothetical protein